VPRKYVHTKAIVLKRINYKDADKIITLYTKEEGKLTALAKGIRKISSRKKSHLELFNIIDCYLVEGKNWYIITQAESIKSFKKIKDDLELTQMGYYALEIFEKLIQDGEPNEQLFNLLANTFIQLSEKRNINIINAFNLKLIKLIGFLPNLSTFPNEVQKHMELISKQALKDVSVNTKNFSISKKTYYILRNYTEEILEKEIRTKVDFRE